MSVTLILYLFIYTCTVHIFIIKQNILYMYIPTSIGRGYKN